MQKYFSASQHKAPLIRPIPEAALGDTQGSAAVHVQPCSSAEHPDWLRVNGAPVPPAVAGRALLQQSSCVTSPPVSQGLPF